VNKKAKQQKRRRPAKTSPVNDVTRRLVRYRGGRNLKPMTDEP